MIKRDIYTLQWSSMVILLYFTEGVVRAWSDTAPLSRLMALGEIVLVCVYFACALLYLRPYKKAAKRIAKELLEKVKVHQMTDDFLGRCRDDRRRRPCARPARPTWRPS